MEFCTYTAKLWHFSTSCSIESENCPCAFGAKTYYLLHFYFLNRKAVSRGGNKKWRNAHILLSVPLSSKSITARAAGAADVGGAQGEAGATGATGAAGMAGSGDLAVFSGGNFSNNSWRMSCVSVFMLCITPLSASSVLAVCEPGLRRAPLRALPPMIAAVLQGLSASQGRRTLRQRLAAPPTW